MSHNKNNEFHKTLTDRIHEGDVTVRQLFSYRQEGLLSDSEVSMAISCLLNPDNYKVPENYEINGHKVTKERYERYLKEIEDKNV